MPGPDPKPAARVVDREAMQNPYTLGDECSACGRPPGSHHHVLPRGEGGDDDPRNLVLLCGSGTSDCHGAWHGNPYAVTPNDGRPVWGRPAGSYEIRNRAWVAQRIGEHIKAHRPDTIAYVIEKLGDERGRDYLRRVYALGVAAAPSTIPA